MSSNKEEKKIKNKVRGPKQSDLNVLPVFHLRSCINHSKQTVELQYCMFYRND